MNGRYRYQPQKSHIGRSLLLIFETLFDRHLRTYNMTVTHDKSGVGLVEIKGKP